MGILYCKAGQSSEEEMYNNEAAGPALDEFLSLLGEKVSLKSFTKYAAQLDTKSEPGDPGAFPGFGISPGEPEGWGSPKVEGFQELGDPIG